jgi:DNA-binding MarR family transcriptional regulator
VTTEVGPVEVTMPRDRNATFDPKLVPKGTAAPTTVSSYVKRFERRGHITRTPNAEDGRSYRLELSAAGRDAHRHAGELFAPVLTQTDERLGAHAQTVREQLLKLLRAVDTIRDEHR